MHNHTTTHNKTVKIIAAVLSFLLFMAALTVSTPPAFAADETQTEQTAQTQPPSGEPTATDEPQTSQEAQSEPQLEEPAPAEPDQIIQVDGAECDANDVIVKYKDTLTDSAVQFELNAVESVVQETLDDDGLVVADVPEGETVESFIDTLEDQTNVEYVQPNYVYKLNMSVNDYYASSQWYLSKINVYNAWDITQGSSGVRVAVLDTGIDLSHPEFTGQICAQTDCVDHDGNANDAVDGHGTHVAGIIAAKANNSIGIAGIAPGAQLIIVDVFDGAYAYTTDLIEGIQYAVDNGADIINMSLGAAGTNPALEAAINSAVSAGVVCVVAAGNDNTDATYFPSDIDSVISVIATDSSDHRASFSNYGAAKDISAPGVDILSTYPGGYAWSDGTSMASPVVCGVVALMLSVNPGLTVSEIKNILYSTAVDLGATGKDNEYGYGRVNAYQSVLKALPNYSVSVTKTLLGASDSSYGNVSGGGTFSNGSTATVSAVASAGYEFIRWSINGAEVSTNPTYTFTVTANVTLTAEFAPRSYTITASPNNPSYGSVSGGGTYNRNDTVTLSAAANAGYRFVRWLENGTQVSANPSYSFTATKNTSVTAEFTVLTPVAISFATANTTLYGGADGAVTISASGGYSGAYSYSINSGVSWQSSGSFGGLAAGTYTAVVCDANDASNAATGSFTIGQPAYVGSVAAKRMSTKANAGTAISLVPPPAPRGYTLQSVNYSSSNPAVAAVDASGNVTFLAGGRAVIITRITSQTVDKKGRIRTKITTVRKKVTVKQPIEFISLNLPDATIARAQRVKLIPSIAPATASNKKLKWTTSNKRVATVSSSGVVTGRAGGTAVITCTARDGSYVSASCTVTVTPIYPTGLKLSKTSLTLKTGKTTSVRATILPKKTDFKTVQWTSSDPAIATVDARGRIRGLASGTVVITATTSNGLRASCTVTVL